MPYYIQILELEQDKYYVKLRDDTDFTDNSEWITLYKPLSIIETVYNCKELDVDKYTRIYMEKYGIENVRGGSFSSVELEKSVIYSLTTKSITPNKYLYDLHTIEEIEIEIKNTNELIQQLQIFNVNTIKYVYLSSEIYNSGRISRNDVDAVGIVLKNNGAEGGANTTDSGDDLSSKRSVQTISTKIEINPALYFNQSVHKTSVIESINNIFNGYVKQPVLIHNFIKIKDSGNETEYFKTLNIKINAIYIERRKQEIRYGKSLPPKYAEIFKKNKCENIFELVKEDILFQLELLYNKLADIVSHDSF